MIEQWHKGDKTWDRLLRRRTRRPSHRNLESKLPIKASFLPPNISCCHLFSLRLEMSLYNADNRCNFSLCRFLLISAFFITCLSSSSFVCSAMVTFLLLHQLFPCHSCHPNRPCHPRHPCHPVTTITPPPLSTHHPPHPTHTHFLFCQSEIGTVVR